MAPGIAGGEEVIYQCRGANDQITWRSAPCNRGETPVAKQAFKFDSAPKAAPSCSYYAHCEATLLPLEVRQSGSFNVPVLINGAFTTLMTLDTGATISTITSQTLEQLQKQRLVPANTTFRTNQATLADGSLSKTQQFTLESLQVGKVLTKGIEISVQTSATAPQLLGMNVLSRFKWRLDHERNLLVIE